MSVTDFLDNWIIRPAKSGPKNGIATKEIETSAVTPVPPGDRPYEKATGPDEDFVVRIVRTGVIGSANPPEFQWAPSPIVWNNDESRWEPESDTQWSSSIVMNTVGPYTLQNGVQITFQKTSLPTDPDYKAGVDVVEWEPTIDVGTPDDAGFRVVGLTGRSMGRR